MISLLSYVLSIKKTIFLYQENNRLEKLVAKGEKSLVSEISQLSGAKERIDSLKQFYTGDESDALLLQVLVKKANRFGIEVTAVDERLDQNDLVFEYTLEGGYRNMIRFLRDVEATIKSVKILNVAFIREENRRTKSVSLIMKLTFKKHEYE